MSHTADFAKGVKASLDGFIRTYLSIFGKNPQFDLSIFCIEKGKSLASQELASRRYRAEDFKGEEFQAKLKRELLRSEYGVVNEIRNYGNFFPKFYHDFLNKRCRELSRGRNEKFFPLPRYTFDSHIYLPVFSIDLSWLADYQKASLSGSEESDGFFPIVLNTMRLFLEDETKISGRGVNIDDSQPPRLQARAAAAFLNKITGNPSFYNHINTVASLKYENKDNPAQIAICRQIVGLPLLARFETPIPVGENRTTRKLLAATGEKHCLVCSGEHFMGIANIKNIQKWEGAPVHFIYLLKHLTWELVHDGKLLMRYTEGGIYTNRHEMKDR